MTRYLMSAEPSPAPGEIDPYLVSPGIEGFLTFFVLAIFGWLLFTSMFRHIRKANFHAKQREERLYGQAARPRRRTIPIDPNLRPRQGPFAHTVLGAKEAKTNDPTAPVEAENEDQGAEEEAN
ncbi:MAG: hypothetical protein Q4Q03_06755 [Bowdeniella nasicola]|nr:hypothetical protein [Bowdeniella nasicola]